MRWLPFVMFALTFSLLGSASAQTSGPDEREDLAEDALATDALDSVALALRDEAASRDASDDPRGQARALAALALHLERGLAGQSGERRSSLLEQLRRVWGELGALRVQHPNVVPAGVARVRATAIARAIAATRDRSAQATPPSTRPSAAPLE